MVAGAGVSASMYSGVGTGAEADTDPYESVGTYKGAGSTGMDEGTGRYFNLVALDYIPKVGLEWVGNCNELNAGE